MADLSKAWKTAEEIEAEKLKQEEEQRKSELTPDPEQRIEMLENMLLGLMLQL